LKISGETYPDLVRVLLTNMWYDDDTIYSQVKGMDIAINEEVWLAVTGLRNDSVVVSRGNTTKLGNQDSATRTFSVGGLGATPRILPYIVI